MAKKAALASQSDEDQYRCQVTMVQRAALASQSEWTTLHSYHGLPYMQKDGQIVAHKDKDKDLSSKFMRYQTLRFMFVDELSTVSLDICAEIDYNMSTHIRERGTSRYSSMSSTGSNYRIEI